jgi:hypothetical protein
MTKLLLLKTIDKAIVNKNAVAVMVENTVENKLINGVEVKHYFEMIINNFENLREKREYYYNSYDEECKLYNNKNIRIVAVFEGKETILLRASDYLN